MNPRIGPCSGTRTKAGETQDESAQFPDYVFEDRAELVFAAFGVQPATALLLSLTAISTNAQSSSTNDEGYTKKILEDTTEPIFLTNLVDHLPASATIPTPEKVLGHIIGAPDVLTYFRRTFTATTTNWPSASPRVKVFRVGQTEEGPRLSCWLR